MLHNVLTLNMTQCPDTDIQQESRNFWCLPNEYSENAYGSDRTDLIPNRFKTNALAFELDNSNTGARKE